MYLCMLEVGATMKDPWLCIRSLDCLNSLREQMCNGQVMPGFYSGSMQLQVNVKQCSLTMERVILKVKGFGIRIAMVGGGL